MGMTYFDAPKVSQLYIFYPTLFELQLKYCDPGAMIVRRYMMIILLVNDAGFVSVRI